MQTRKRVSHLPFDFSFGHEGRDRIDDDNVHRTRPHQDFADLEALLARIGLRDEQILDIHAQLLGVLDVERMLGIDVGGGTAQALRVGYHVQRQCRLAARLRPENLRDPAAGDAADADRRIEIDGPGRDPRHAHLRRVGAHPHDGPLAARLFDLGDREAQRLAAVIREFGRLALLRFCHE